MVVELELKNQYSCFLTKNVAGRVAIFNNFAIAMSKEFKTAASRLNEAGFSDVWKTWDTFGGELGYHTRYKGKLTYNKRIDFISFTNLLSFNILIVCLLMIAMVCWICEVLYGRKRNTVQVVNHWRVWCRRSKYVEFAKYVTIKVSSFKEI